MKLHVAPPVPMTDRDRPSASAMMAVRLAVVAHWQLVAPPRNPGTLCTGADPCPAAGGADATALVVRRRRPKRVIVIIVVLGAAGSGLG